MEQLKEDPDYKDFTDAEIRKIASDEVKMYCSECGTSVGKYLQIYTIAMRDN